MDLPVSVILCNRRLIRANLQARAPKSRLSPLCANAGLPHSSTCLLARSAVPWLVLRPGVASRGAMSRSTSAFRNSGALSDTHFFIEPLGPPNCIMARLASRLERSWMGMNSMSLVFSSLNVRPAFVCSPGASLSSSLPSLPRVRNRVSMCTVSPNDLATMRGSPSGCGLAFAGASVIKHIRHIGHRSGIGGWWFLIKCSSGTLDKAGAALSECSAIIGMQTLQFVGFSEPSRRLTEADGS